MRMKAQHGFTLIELMLVVSIIGILAAIALAAYDSEVKRARMAEVILGATACKTVVTEYFAVTRPDQVSLSVPRCDGPRSQYIGGFVVANSGEIIIQSAVPGATGYLKLTPMAADGFPARVLDMPLTIYRWRCGPALDWGPVDVRFLPGSCREDDSVS